MDVTGVYVVGYTGSAVLGQGSCGGSGDNVFVRKYDVNGNEQWTRQFGSESNDHASGVAVDASGVYVVGWTEGRLSWQISAGAGDAFVRKYDFIGNEVWTQQFGTTGNDLARGVAIDATGIYVGGNTAGALPGQTSAGSGDAFVRKYDADGNEQWTRQFGSPNNDSANGVAVDASGVYVVGRASGPLAGQSGAGQQDAFVRKYDANGTEIWTRQFGSATDDYATGVAVDTTGVYIAGYTYGALPGQISAGARDAFVRKYDFIGNEVWTRQFGSGGQDLAKVVAVDVTGAYVAGFTNSLLPGSTTLGYAFVVKLEATHPPGPSPAVNDGGVVNNASFASSPAPVAPGSIAAVFGSNLNDGLWLFSSSFGPDGKLVTSLGGASVTVNNIAAPMFYSTPEQLGVQIPFELAGRTSATIHVTVSGRTSVSRTIPLDAFAPGIFTRSQDGRGTAVALHEDSITPVTLQRPARQGEVVVLYATGLGAVTPPLATGAPSTGNRTVSTPTVLFATGYNRPTVPGEVLFSGAAPGFVGLYQINVKIPRLNFGALPSGAIPQSTIMLRIGGKESNWEWVTISVYP